MNWKDSLNVKSYLLLGLILFIISFVIKDDLASVLYGLAAVMFFLTAYQESEFKISDLTAV